MGDRGRRKLIGMGNRIIVWDKPKIECTWLSCALLLFVVCDKRDDRIVKGGGEL